MNNMDRILKMLAAAESTSGATTDIIDLARSGKILSRDDITLDQILLQLADGMQLIIACLEERDTDIDQLSGTLTRFLEERA